MATTKKVTAEDVKKAAETAKKAASEAVAEAKTAVNNLKSNLPTTDNQERVDSSYYSKYSVEDEESYYSVIRMGTTVLACAVDMEEKGSCQQVASALGY